ncbi:recombinase family protein [Candidatus Tisiphia endosymbiont of Ceraclea dissimilis]|uniref:recombinase family protein n=1 Tax=Candidatus Tisiphia endosymbiont of Ceraclea dissimilis TaxID=3077928 RepID=UPI003CCB47AD
MEEPIKDGKIELHFRTEGYILTKDSQSHEKLVWGMNVLMAQSYVDSLSDNVKRSLDHKLRKGEWIGPAPIGYLNSRDVNGNSTVILDSSRAFIIKKLFEEYATGAYTLGSIVTMAKELGLRSKKNYYLNKTVLHRLMQQPFYYGEMLVKGEMWLHNYPPIITRETFMACKEVLLGWNKKPFKYGGKDFLFRELITCATTGKIVTSEIHSKTYANGKVEQWVYLAAWDLKNPNKKIYVREDEVLAKIEEIFKKIGIKRDPELLKDTLEHLKNTNELKKDEHDEAIASLKKEHTENKKRLNSLIDLRLNSELSTEEFQAKKQQLKDRQYEINRLLKIYDEADDKFTDTASTFITLASEAYEIFKGSEMPQKRKMIKFVFQNLKLRGKKLETFLCFPFDIFEKTTTRTEWRGVVNNFRTQSDIKLLIIQTSMLILE